MSIEKRAFSWAEYQGIVFALAIFRAKSQELIDYLYISKRHF